MMAVLRIVMGTNVLYAGLYSSRGASHALLRAIDQGVVRIVLSPALLFEYEEVLRRNQVELGLSDQAIEELLNTLCQVSEHQKVYFLWRPCLPDVKDDHVLELAVASGVDSIVTHNVRHFEGAARFGIKVSTAKEMLESIA
jgi:putative PIN family toxin of toxin-antitoxin system